MPRTLWVALIAIALSASSIRADEPAPGKQIEQKLDVGGDRSIPYLFYLPKDYGKGETNWPVMLFLHGRGESKPPLATVAKWGPPRILGRGEHLPYIVVSPQCPEQESWNHPSQQELLVKLLDHVVKDYKVDAGRVYLTGLSMGGYGSWRLAADHPERFAAVVPICGGGKPEDASKIKDLPIWVFHGTEDKAVPLIKSQEMVDAIKQAGGTNLYFTVLEHLGHISWEAAYTAPDLYHWLDKQRKAGQ